MGSAIGVGVGCIGLGREVTGFLISILIESIGIGVSGLIGEVENSRGVDGIAHVAGFEVEVRAG